jgi:hypothetical protein
LKHGELLRAAEAAGFELTVTTDQKIPYQQNLGDRNIAIMIFCAPTNKRRDLERLLPAAVEALADVRAGEVRRITRLEGDVV